MNSSVALSLGLLFLCSGASIPENNASALSVVDGMLEAINRTHQLTYKMKAWERFGDEMIYSEADVRMQAKPFKIYMKTYAPDPNIEILYVDGERNGLALVKPNGFPYVSVKLDPYSSRMREGQHHTLKESGFNYFGDIIRRSLEQHRSEMDRYVQLEDGASWDGRACYKLTINNPIYAWVNYTVKPGEDLISIARKTGVSEHAIIERNPSLKDYKSAKAGMSIRIPNAYSKKTILFIDKGSFLPVVKLIYDDLGLYERYEFHGLNAQPRLKADAFNSSCPDYGF